MFLLKIAPLIGKCIQHAKNQLPWSDIALRLNAKLLVQKHFDLQICIAMCLVRET